MNNVREEKMSSKSRHGGKVENWETRSHAKSKASKASNRRNRAARKRKAITESVDF
jgi:hypothetical protein